MAVVVLVAVLAAGRDQLAGSSFMPHFGQRSGLSLVTSGCIGQTYVVSSAAWASSFIPHFGQLPGSSLTTSGCIGQT